METERKIVIYLFFIKTLSKEKMFVHIFVVINVNGKRRDSIGSPSVPPQIQQPSIFPLSLYPKTPEFR